MKRKYLVNGFLCCMLVLLFSCTVQKGGKFKTDPQLVQSFKNNFTDAAETMIGTLSADQYRAQAGTNGGFILKHGVGHIPQGTEVDVPLTYADYYFIEAMKRYKNL